MGLYAYYLVNEEARDVREVFVNAPAEWKAFNDMLDMLPEVEEAAGHELELAAFKEITLH